ncbi:glycosyltransferase [Brucella intermedia]|uniref:glycosyltransferase n=1 Tax=Brucella intermedia TaxID=94625 RepID=UPI00124D6857|nr:glycosyltransferase [Brucella intermedia]KAB2713833.1 glycosyltransferase family 1 protein [Brucella intermedia]
MTAKQIIIASTHPFMADMRFGTSYLAEALCELGWDILYIEQPTSPLHLVHSRARDRAWRKAAGALRTFSGNAQTYRFGDGNLTLLQTIVPWPHINMPLLRGEHILNVWWKYTFPRLSGVFTRSRLVHPQAFLTDSPYFYSLAQNLRLPVIYRYADRIQYFTEVTPALLAKQQVALRSSDIVLYTSKAMQADLQERTKTTYYLPNGVNTALYGKPCKEPSELIEIPKPRIIYSGTLGPWLDVSAIRAAALALPNMQFVLLGQSSTEHPSLTGISNVHFLGTVPHYRVPEFLQHSQVGIIPFDIINQPDLVRAINPLKLYEYCASGLPVVSYISEETIKAGDLIDYYKTPDEFITSIHSALGRADASTRKDWADKMSWSNRALELQDLILNLSLSNVSS